MKQVIVERMQAPSQRRWRGTVLAQRSRARLGRDVHWTGIVGSEVTEMKLLRAAFGTPHPRR